jgi:hypothetical protein
MLIRRLLSGVHSANSQYLAGQIRQAMLGSGIFLESLLARGSPPDTDLKAGLLRLLYLLRPQLSSAEAQPGGTTQPAGEPTRQTISTADDPILSGLLRKVEGALARIQVNQLSSLPDDQKQVQAWQFDIPMHNEKHTDLIRIAVEQDRNPKKNHAATGWRVSIQLGLKELGPILVRMALDNIDQISVRFWTEQLRTCDRIQQAMPKLEQAFLHAGLKVRDMGVHQGIPEHSPSPMSPSPLLDEKA